MDVFVVGLVFFRDALFCGRWFVVVVLGGSFGLSLVVLVLSGCGGWGLAWGGWVCRLSWWGGVGWLT